MTRYSVQSRDRVFVKDYGFLFFAKNICKNIGKKLSGNYSQKLLHYVKQSERDVLNWLHKCNKE